MNKHLKCLLKFVGVFVFLIPAVLLTVVQLFLLAFIALPLAWSGCVKDTRPWMDKLFDPFYSTFYEWYAKL